MSRVRQARDIAADVLRARWPWTMLGGLAGAALVLLAISGAWLFAVFDTSASGAHASIARLSIEQPFTGGLVRSLHRYAADLFLLATVLHLLRELLLGRFRAWRAFTWWTGLPLLALAYVAAIGGFWLNWDRLGQFAAEASAEWLDVLPFAGSFARNFLDAGQVDDRLFSLLVFVHVGVPLLLLFGLWFHLQRLQMPVLLPPRRVLAGLIAALVLLALAWPVASLAPADPATAIVALPIDWWLLHPLVLAEGLGGGVTWILVGALVLSLVLLPRWGGVVLSPAAVVDPAACSGCGDCVADCPYEAITLASPAPGRLLAVVSPERCAACGICVGSCPTANPLMPGARIRPGIDLPDAPVDGLRHRVDAALAGQSPGVHLVFACVPDGATPGRITVPVRCAAQVPTGFVEYALRRGAGHVVFRHCGGFGCRFRLGVRWLEARLARRRTPKPRRQVPDTAFSLEHAGGEPPTRGATP